MGRVRAAFSWRHGGVGLGLLCAGVMGCGGTAASGDLQSLLEAELRGGTAEVAVYYRNLGAPDSALVNPDLRMHAASTMKVPVLIQLVLDDADGRLRLDDSLEVTNEFNSIVDGSPYQLDAGSDSDSTLYQRLGERVQVLDLAELMITRSSNLATNLLIREVDAGRVTATMRDLGADSIQVLRGVEDIPAFEAGLSNTTTARDMGVLMAALAGGGVAGAEASEAMLEMLSRQEFREMIPSGVPPGTTVANKDGWITGIRHDVAVVFPEGHSPYALVVLTRGFENRADAEATAARLSRIVYTYHTTS